MFENNIKHLFGFVNMICNIFFLYINFTPLSPNFGLCTAQKPGRPFIENKQVA